MFNDALAFGNFLLFSHHINQYRFPLFTNNRVVPRELVDVVKRTADSITTAVKWQEYDVLILDNTRFLHGRNQIVDVNNRLILSFFGYLRFAIPSEEEISDPPWRKAAFTPPR